MPGKSARLITVRLTAGQIDALLEGLASQSEWNESGLSKAELRRLDAAYRRLHAARRDAKE